MPGFRVSSDRTAILLPTGDVATMEVDRPLSVAFDHGRRIPGRTASRARLRRNVRDFSRFGFDNYLPIW